MLGKRTTWMSVSLLAALAVLFAACAPPPAPTAEVIRETQVVRETVVVQEQVEVPVEVAVTSTPSPSQPQGTLTIGLTTNVTALEQAYAPERNSSNASWTMFDSLVFPEPDGTYSPALAESWDVSDDGTTYTFHLRQGVTFHNGAPFTADDVVFSWETYKQPEVTYANNWLIADNVEKIDDFTVEVSTAEPNALLLPYIATAWAISPVDYGGLTAEEFAAAHQNLLRLWSEV